MPHMKDAERTKGETFRAAKRSSKPVFLPPESPFLLCPIKSGASLGRGDFAPREPEFRVEFWDANF